ncbi:unnamed protein product [Rotaria socialis]
MFMPNLRKLTLSIRDTPDRRFSHGSTMESMLNKHVPHLCQFHYTMAHREKIEDFRQWSLRSVYYEHDNVKWIHMFSVPWPSNQQDKREVPIINGNYHLSVISDVKYTHYLNYVNIITEDEMLEIKEEFSRSRQLQISKLILSAETPICSMNFIPQGNIHCLPTERRLIDENEIKILANRFPRVRYLELLFPLEILSCVIFFALMPMYSMQYGILLPNEKQDDKLQLQSFSTKSESTLINKILQHIKEKTFDENKFSDSLNTEKLFNIMMTSDFDPFHYDYYKYCLETKLNTSSFGPSINYRIIVFTVIAPVYSIVYRVIRDDLLNPLLNIDAANETKINKLQSFISDLNATFFMTFTTFSSNEFLNTSRQLLSYHDLKLAIDSHEMCISNLQFYLHQLQKRSDDIETSAYQMKTLYLQNFNLYNEAQQKYSKCWFFCEKLKNEINSRHELYKSSLVDAFSNTHELVKVTEDISKAGKTLDRHSKELNQMKTRLLPELQQEVAFDIIIEKFKEMYNNLRSTSIHSNSSDYIIDLLFRIQSIIIPLHNIYDVAQENYFPIPPAKPFITNEDIEKIKLKITQLQFVSQANDTQSSTTIF